MRDPRSVFRPYCATLPAPSGSRIAAVARGPPQTDLLLFSDDELSELHCAGLADAIAEEKGRLVRLHEALWGPPESDPAVSIESFVWAHCLVSSRTIGLIPTSGDAGNDDDSAAGGAGGRVVQRCLLPAVDLCNHSLRPTATLTWPPSTSGECGSALCVDLMSRVY